MTLGKTEEMRIWNLNIRFLEIVISPTEHHSRLSSETSGMIAIGTSPLLLGPS